MSTFKAVTFFISGAVASTNGHDYYYTQHQGLIVPEETNLVVSQPDRSDPWGCCFNVVFGKASTYGTPQWHPTWTPVQGGDVVKSHCKVQQGEKSVTLFVEYETCWKQGLAWPEANRVAADPTGCCFHVIFGKAGTYGSPQWHPTWTPVQGGDVSKSQCKVEQGEKSATLFIEETCAWMEHNVWNQGLASASQPSKMYKPEANPSSSLTIVAPKVAADLTGCCFHVIFGKDGTYGTPQWHPTWTPIGDVLKSQCKVQQGEKSATLFVEYLTCEWLLTNVWDSKN